METRIGRTRLSDQIEEAILKTISAGEFPVSTKPSLEPALSEIFKIGRPLVNRRTGGDLKTIHARSYFHVGHDINPHRWSPFALENTLFDRHHCAAQFGQSAQTSDGGVTGVAAAADIGE